MNTPDSKHIKIAKKYSQALFQSALETNKTEKVYSDIVFISETIETNEELKNALMSPVVTVSDKKDIVQKLFKIHVEQISLDFIYLLIDKCRLECLNEIISCYNQSNNRQKNIIMPVITSAVELNEVQKANIVKKLTIKTKKEIIPQYKVEPEIIGGLIIEIGDMTIDCSIKTQFENIKKQLTKGNYYGSN